tara:strand:- start:348 stop:767 length:420 start_codon:yes stop_codon:yes gene_type:complete
MIRIKIGMAKTKSGANVILVKDGKILLLLRRLGWKTGYWGPPGGHIDAGETPKQAAVRETYEEAGLRIKESDLELVAQRTKNDFGMIYYYTTDKFTGKGVALSHEHKSFTWADWKKIEGLDTIFEPDILALIERLLPSK